MGSDALISSSENPTACLTWALDETVTTENTEQKGINMYLESGRALVQGIMTLVFAAIAYWVNLPLGLALLAFMGVMRIQESATDWCPSDLRSHLETDGDEEEI